VAERTRARINFAPIESAVSIHVQEPFSCTGTENADPHLSCSIPISDNRQIPPGAKLPKARVHTTPVESPVSVRIQVPQSFPGEENADLFLSGAIPVANHRERIKSPKRIAFVCRTTIERAIRVKIEIPETSLDYSSPFDEGYRSRPKGSDDVSIEAAELSCHR
jgi:hypothetical protein